MTSMYRFDQLHSERKSLALLKDHEWGFDYMRSFKARLKRENCVFDTAPEPEALPDRGIIDKHVLAYRLP